MADFFLAISELLIFAMVGVLALAALFQLKVIGRVAAAIGLSGLVAVRTRDDRNQPRRIVWNLPEIIEHDDRATLIMARARRESGLPNPSFDFTRTFIVFPSIAIITARLIGLHFGLAAIIISAVVLGRAMFVHRRHQRAMSRAAVELHRCGACGYPFTGPPEADHCAVCSECGAAWEVD